MKNIVTIFFLCAFSQLFSQNTPKEVVLESILRISQISELLDLDNLSDRGPIRVIDKTGKFKKCSFLFTASSDPKGIPLQVATINEYPLDLNTGYYRDIAILSLRKEKNLYLISLYLSNYQCRHDKKNRWHFNIKYTCKKNIVKIIEISFAEWH